MASSAAAPASAPAPASLSHPRPLLPSPPPFHIQMSPPHPLPHQSLPHPQLPTSRPLPLSPSAVDDSSSSAKPHSAVATILKDLHCDASPTRPESGNELLVQDGAPESSTLVTYKAEILKDVSNASVDAGDTVKTDDQESRSSKATWQKPLVTPQDQRPTQAVLGALVWPALAETRNIKSSQVKNQKDLALNTTNAHASKEPKFNGSVPSFNDVSVSSRTKQSWEKPNAPLEGSLPGNNRPNSATVTNTSGFVKHDMKTRSASSIPEHQVPYHRNDSSGNNMRKWRNNNSNNNRDHGKGHQGWHHHHGRGYENGSDMPVILHEQRIGPRNMPRPAHPTFLNVNSGFYHPVPFPNGSMYYVPPGMQSYVPNTGYFPPVGFPPGMMHGPDQSALRSMLLKQIEYYFSVENLCKDIYLRSNMDEQGFVPVSLIASFNRVQMLSADPNVILEALQHSSVIEVQYDRIRRREDWKKWVLNSAQMNNVHEENFVVRDEAEHKGSSSELEPEASATEVPDRVANKSDATPSSLPFGEALNLKGSGHDQQSSIRADASTVHEHYTSKLTEDSPHSESIFTSKSHDREPEGHLELNNKETHRFINVSHAEHGSVISVP